MNGQPMVGNLAWAPLPAFEEVEVLDRFNGVPTLGVFGKPGDKILFWRAWGMFRHVISPYGSTWRLARPMRSIWRVPSPPSYCMGWSSRRPSGVR